MKRFFNLITAACLIVGIIMSSLVFVSGKGSLNLKAAEAGSDYVQLSWDSAGTGAKYNVYYYRNGFEDKKFVSTTSSRSVKINGLRSYTDYTFYVITSDGKQSDQVSTKTRGKMNQMTLTYSVDGTTVKLNWDSAGSAPYSIYYMRVNSDSDYKLLKETKSCSVTITGLQPETSYFFRVYSKNEEYFGMCGVESGKKSSSESSKSSSESKSKAKLLANEIKNNSYTTTSSSVYIQNPIDYFGSSISQMKCGTVKDTYSITLEGSDDYMSLIDSYFRTITNGNYNMSLVSDFSERTFTGYAKFEYAVKYTGKGTVRHKEKTFYKNVEGNITCYGYLEKTGKFHAYISIPTEMDMVDMGLRLNGKNVSCEYAGESSTSGLKLNSDGSYSTSDDRLTVKVGKACVIKDGKKYTGTVKFDSTYKPRYCFTVSNFDGDDALMAVVDPETFKTGIIYNFSDMTLNTTSTITDFENTLFSGIGKWITKCLFIKRGRSALEFPQPGGRGGMSNATVRVMYADDNVAVVYMYAEMDSKPYKYEVLCAVDISKPKDTESSGSKSSSGSDTSFDSSGSRRDKFVPEYKTICWKCHGEGELACDRCKGTGRIYKTVSVPNYTGKQTTQKTTWSRCSSCGGDGKVDCNKCDDGWIIVRGG